MTALIIIAVVGWGFATLRHWDATELRKLLDAEVAANDRYLATNTILRENLAALKALTPSRDSLGRFVRGKGK